MRISPWLPPTTGASAPAKNTASGSPSAIDRFEALLAAAPPRTAVATPPPTRAFRFSELGVLGGRGATRDPAQPTAAPPGAAPVAAVQLIAPRTLAGSQSDVIGAAPASPSRTVKTAPRTRVMDGEVARPAAAASAAPAVSAVRFEGLSAAVPAPTGAEAAGAIPTSGPEAAARPAPGVAPAGPQPSAQGAEAEIRPAQVPIAPGPAGAVASWSPTAAGRAVERAAPPPAARAAARSAETQSAQAASDASLVVHEGEGGVLQIIAAAPGLTAEDAGQLRQRSAEIGAEFGVSVSDLYVNGAAASPPLRILGASRASSTR